MPWKKTPLIARKKKRPKPKNWKPPWPKGVSGNPKGKPKGQVRRWDAVMREFFDLVQNDPEKLEKLTGLKVPASISSKDAQLLLVQQEFYRAIKGLGRAAGELMDRMDGKADQKIQLEGRSIIELIQDGQKEKKEAQAEASKE